MQTFKIEKNDTQCVVTLHFFSRVALFVMLFFFVIWTSGCVAMVCAAYVHQELGWLLLALPFWLFWFAGFAMFVNMLFGKMRLVLDAAGLESSWTCLFFQRGKWIDLIEICEFKHIVHVDANRRASSVQIRVICRERNVNYYCFPSGVQEIDDLCTQLNAFLETLKAASSVDAP